MALNDSVSDIGKAIVSLRAEVEALKRPTSICLGLWIISQSQYGDLIADNSADGKRYVLAAADKSTGAGILERKE